MEYKKEMYIMPLRQRIDRVVAENNEFDGTYKEVLESKRLNTKELNGLVDKLDEDIISMFYLNKALEFQDKYYD